MGNFKVIETLGTLCEKCDHSLIRQGQGAAVVICSWAGRDWRVTERVERCNQFQDKNTPSKHDYAKIGWVLETNKAEKVGFRPPNKSERAGYISIEDAETM